MKSQTIESQRVFEQTSTKPVEEDPATRSHSCLVILRRRPGNSKAGREIELVLQVRLEFVTKSRRERQGWAKPNVVLNKQRSFVLAVFE